MNKCVTLVLMASALLLAGCATPPPAAPRWEYKVASPPRPFTESPGVVSVNREAFLNDLGQDGWMLVSQSDGRVFYFIRPLR